MDGYPSYVQNVFYKKSVIISFRPERLCPGELEVALQNEGGQFWQMGGHLSLSRHG